MSIFDSLKKNIASTNRSDDIRPTPSVQKSETFTFNSLPESLSQMQALPEASLTSPFAVAALSVCALCAYAADKKIGIEMLNWLKGPRPLSAHEISFLDDRFRDGKHVPFSYFKGATPANDYTPDVPFTVTFEAGPYADANRGYKKLHVKSGGADSPREIVLRQKSDGTWALWDQFLMVSVRDPRSADPWA